MNIGEQTTLNTLPPFRRLAGIALLSCIVPAAVAALLTRPISALSVAAGLIVGLALYGSIYLFVGRGMDSFVRGIRGKVAPKATGSTILFTAMLPLKYIGLGALIWLFWRTEQLNFFWFGTGFVMTQISITAATALQMARRSRW